jgi:hypothetical protein
MGATHRSTQLVSQVQEKGPTPGTTLNTTLLSVQSYLASNDGDTYFLPTVSLKKLGCPEITIHKEITMTTITTAKVTFAVEHINPAKAAHLLSISARNRNLRREVVNSLSSDMKGGLWNSDQMDPIRINWNGELMDGQHRLHAIIQSGTTYPFLVVRGLPPSRIETIDAGAPKTLPDVLTIQGESYARLLSTAVAHLMAYEKTGVFSPVNRHRPSRTALLNYLYSHPRIHHYLVIGNQIRKVVRGGGRWVALAYLFSQQDEEDADYFLSHLHSGEDLPADSPILLLRTRLIEDMHRHSVHRMSPLSYSAIAIKAWNLFRTGQTSRILSWRPGGAKPEPFPAIQ